MYTQDNFVKNAISYRRSRIWLAVLLAAGIPAVIAVAILRYEALTMLLTILVSFAAIFIAHTQIIYRRDYSIFLHDIINGDKKEISGRFVSVSPNSIIRDGAFFHDMLMRVDGEKREEDRLFFFDGRMDIPELTAGDNITVRYKSGYVYDVKVQAAAEA